MTNTAKVLKIIANSPMYRGLMCLAVGNIGHYYRHRNNPNEWSATEKLKVVNVCDQISAEGLDPTDLAYVTKDIYAYMDFMSVPESSYVMVEKLYAFAGRKGKPTNLCSTIVKTLRPLYSNWDQRPKTKEEAEAYLKEHYDKHR